MSKNFDYDFEFPKLELPKIELPKFEDFEVKWLVLEIDELPESSLNDVVS